MELKIGAIMVSNKILINHEQPNWMYRDRSIAPADSGWRVFSGFEDEEYLNNPQNFRTITAEQLIEIDDDIKVNLLAPVGASFERDMDTKRWRPVELGFR